MAAWGENGRGWASREERTRFGAAGASRGRGRRGHGVWLIEGRVAGSAARMAGRGPSGARIAGLQMEGPPGGGAVYGWKILPWMEVGDAVSGAEGAREGALATADAQRVGKTIDGKERGGRDVESAEPCTTGQCGRLR
jgi:hypothetical protein